MSQTLLPLSGSPPSPAPAAKSTLDLVTQLWNQGVLWTWKLAALCFMGLWYFAVVSEGWRYLIPQAGIKLSKLPLPGFASLQNDAALRKLDLAHGMALALLLLTYVFMNANLRVLLRPAYALGAGFNAAVYMRLVQLLGILFLGLDALLFYLATSQLAGWGGLRFSVTTLIATLLYVSVIVAVSFVTVHLEGKTKEKT